MLIKKIIERKTRTGILAFFLGLLIAIGALYSDVIRGDSFGTIGIYQVVGALTGYMISGAGVVLVMKETNLRKTIQNILISNGCVITVISVAADNIGIAGAQGFDRFQIVGVIVGLVILIAGVLVNPQLNLKTYGSPQDQ